MNIYKLRKLLEDGEKAEKTIRERIDNIDGEDLAIPFKASEASDIGTILYEMRAFIESIGIN